MRFPGQQMLFSKHKKTCLLDTDPQTRLIIVAQEVKMKMMTQNSP